MTRSPLAAPTLLAQTSGGAIPEDPGARVVFVVIGLVILGLYLVLRSSRRRSDAAYWEQRRRQREQRDADPDMRRDV